MPRDTKDWFPDLRIILDCCEVQIQRPSSLVPNSQCHSQYKGRTTMKYLVGIAPHGVLTYVSEAWTGCVSDVEITNMGGLPNLLEPGDEVMADKGFTIHKLVQQCHG